MGRTTPLFVIADVDIKMGNRIERMGRYLPMSILPTDNVALGAEREPLFANYRDVPWFARKNASLAPA